MKGVNGRLSAPSSRQPPISTRAPVPRDRSANSLTSRDFPTPASPPTMTADGWPRPTAASAASSAESWPDRPTRTGLDTRGSTSASMPAIPAESHAVAGPGGPPNRYGYPGSLMAVAVLVDRYLTRLLAGGR